jgi:hypothetical protein
MSTHKNALDGVYRLPIYGGAADVKLGAFLRRGDTPGTTQGALIKHSGNNAGPDLIGRLLEPLVYATDGETLAAGTSYVEKGVELCMPHRILRVEYDLTSLITCTTTVTTTTLTLTNLEDDIDAAFLYVASGTGAGQMNFLTAAAAGSCTLKAAFTTSLDTTSKLIKILPRFHQKASLNSDGTKLASQDVVGTWNVMILNSYIQKNGNLFRLSPVDHAALKGLSSLASLKFFADVAVRDSIPASID